MKVNRTYSIDADLVDMLTKEENASKLINQLLSDYFGANRESIERRKLEATNKLQSIEAEEKELIVVEDETSKAKELRERLENEKAKKLELFYKEKAKLTQKAKDKLITFIEYQAAVEKLRDKWGLR